MDIAKIRKKARAKQQEGTAGEVQRGLPAGPQKEEIVPQVEEDLREPVVDEPARDDLQGEPAFQSVAGAEAQEEEAAETEADTLELLTFRLAREEFAFHVSEVEEIIRHQSITRVPTLPDYVLGITSLRGKIIPVIDLRKRLSLREQTDEGRDTNMESDEREGTKEKVLIISGPKGLIGATIDNVMGVVRLPQSSLLDPPAHLSEEEVKFIAGVVILEKRFISVISSEDALNIEVR